MEQKLTNSEDSSTSTENSTDCAAGIIFGKIDVILGMLTYLNTKVAVDVPYLSGFKDMLTIVSREEQSKKQGGTSKLTAEEDDAEEEILTEPQRTV